MASITSKGTRPQPFSWLRLSGIELFVLIIIAIVDYFLGAEAQTLNGYEILRRTFAVPLGVNLPEVSSTYIFLQNEAGQFVLLWAWALYILWGLAFAIPIYLAVRRIGLA